MFIDTKLHFVVHSRLDPIPGGSLERGLMAQSLVLFLNEFRVCAALRALLHETLTLQLQAMIMALPTFTGLAHQTDRLCSLLVFVARRKDDPSW